MRLKQSMPRLDAAQIRRNNLLLEPSCVIIRQADSRQIVDWSKYDLWPFQVEDGLWESAW
jgi:hypothetical protein